MANKSKPSHSNEDKHAFPINHKKILKKKKIFQIVTCQYFVCSNSEINFGLTKNKNYVFTKTNKIYF